MNGACDQPGCRDAATSGPDGTWCYVHMPPLDVTPVDLATTVIVTNPQRLATFYRQVTGGCGPAHDIDDMIRELARRKLLQIPGVAAVRDAQQVRQ